MRKARTSFSGKFHFLFILFLIRGGNNDNLEGYQPEENYEALEDDNVIVDDIQEDGAGDSDEEVEGDDLMDDMERDYEARPELDNYEMDGLDEDDQNELSMNQRMNVDKRLEQEDRLRQLGRRPGALMDEEFDEDDEVLHN
jgi:DNA replication licensing factor MCM2